MKETQKKPKEKQLLDHDTVSRSNVLIESKSSTSLFERKLLNIAIAKAYVEDGELIAKVSTKDVKNYLHITGNSIYSRLKEVSKETLGHVVSIEEDEKENFTCNRSGIRRTKRSASFCNAAGLWCLRYQPISGSGIHQRTDRSAYA